MRILVTRPSEDAGRLVAALAARGHRAIVEPLLHVRFVGEAAAPIDLAGVQAILFTSANGVRAFARMTTRRDVPVFAVGEASAAAARAAGFARVASAGGDVDDLARLVTLRLRPSDGALFHGAARTVAGDLSGALAAAGFAVRREALYETRPADGLSPELRTALERGAIDAATLFSPRTAEIFAKLLLDEGLDPVCTSLVAVCLSAAVAEKIRVLPWRSVRIAAEPNQDALLECIDSLAAESESATVEGAMPVQETGKPDDTAASENDSDDGGQAAHDIIAKFGGIRPMASKLSIAVSTVQGWRERGSIPQARHHQILSAAQTHGIEIDADALAGTDRAPEGHAEPAKPEPGAEPPESAGDAKPDRAPADQDQGAAARPAGTGIKGNWLGGFVAAAVVFALGFGAALVTQDVWAPAPAPIQAEDPNAERIAALEQRLAEIASRPAAPSGAADLEDVRAAIAGLRDDVSGLRGDLAGLEARVASAGAQAGDGDSAELAAALSGLEARNAELAGQLAGLAARNAELASAVSALKGELGALSETGARTRTTESAVALAALQMRDALRGAAPFETELDTIKRVAADAPAAQGAALNEAVAALEPYAAAGAPGLASLRAEFPAVARRVIAQSHGGQGDGILADVIRRIAGLVTVRPVGPVEGEGAAAVAARAEAHLAAGDLAAAVKELDALSGPAAEAAADWRARAEARLAAEAALVRLGQILATPHAAANG